MRALVVVAIAFVAVAAAAAATPPRQVLGPSTVTALAADGAHVVYAVEDCTVWLWELGTRRLVFFRGGPSCARTSTGTGIAAASVAGQRALWLHYTGGNIREWSLWTATPTRRAPRQLAFATSDPDGPAPIVLGEGDASRLGDVLPYAVGRTVVALRSTGARAFSWTAPARVTALAAKAGELAVAVDGGDVHVLGADGRFLRTERFGRTVDAVRIDGRSLVTQTGRSLEVRGDGAARVYSLAPGVRLADADVGRALLTGGGIVRSLRLDSGAGGLVGRGSLAQLEPGRLVVAAGRRVTVTRP